jgi:prepilin-type N-terminal cleavage/methylation domain-containing protein
MKTHHGFTLVELLIALMIFSLISIGALASLNHMMRAREQQVRYHELNQELDLAYGYLFQDMTWLVGDISAHSSTMQFRRTHTSHEQAINSVQYLISDGKLFRSSGSLSEAPRLLLLGKVDNVRLSWLLKNNQWVGVFDQSGLREEPLLLRVQFTAPHLGEVTWVFSLPHL